MVKCKGLPEVRKSLVCSGIKKNKQPNTQCSWSIIVQEDGRSRQRAVHAYRILYATEVGLNFILQSVHSQWMTLCRVTRPDLYSFKNLPCLYVNEQCGYMSKSKRALVQHRDKNDLEQDVGSGAGERRANLKYIWRKTWEDFLSDGMTERERSMMIDFLLKQLHGDISIIHWERKSWEGRV